MNLHEVLGLPGPMQIFKFVRSGNVFFIDNLSVQHIDILPEGMNADDAGLLASPSENKLMFHGWS